MSMKLLHFSMSLRLRAFCNLPFTKLKSFRNSVIGHGVLKIDDVLELVIQGHTLHCDRTHLEAFSLLFSVFLGDHSLRVY
jgi:hypothetical protein